jgi:hypothetical protein
MFYGTGNNRESKHPPLPILQSTEAGLLIKAAIANLLQLQWDTRELLSIASKRIHSNSIRNTPLQGHCLSRANINSNRESSASFSCDGYGIDIDADDKNERDDER